jgi:DNA-binding NarL/FixJ family response regulator
MYRVILADNQDLFRVGLARLLATQGDLQIVAQLTDPARLVAAVATHSANVVITAASLIHSLSDFVAQVKRASGRVLLISDDTSSVDVYRAAGVSGVITRGAPVAVFVGCIRKVLHGVDFVSHPERRPVVDTAGHRAANSLVNSEKRVIALLMEGLKNREIANRLGIREQVVKNKLQSIFDKTGSSNRVELALYVAHHPAFAESLAD